LKLKGSAAETTISTLNYATASSFRDFSESSFSANQAFQAIHSELLTASLNKISTCKIDEETRPIIETQTFRMQGENVIALLIAGKLAVTLAGGLNLAVAL